MLQTLKNKLKKNSFIHGSYMRFKRAFARELVGMTSKTEQDYFAEYGEKIYSGKGEVVDLGCWLGSTTIPLVKGLLKNPAFIESGRKVYAYDLFVWFDWMNSSAVGTNLAGKYKEGDNFVEEFKLRTKEFAEHIEIREGDLKVIGWSQQEKIEFLLVDAMKNWDLANAIVRAFYPSLVPGESIVLHQDYAHFFTPWIHLLQWRFRKNFELVGEVAKSQSVIFKYKSRIDSELLKRNYSFESFSVNDVDEAFDYSMSIVSREKLPNVAAAKVMWFLHQDKRDEARAEFERQLERGGIEPEKDLLIVKEMLEKE
jgi:SAM-dependent methyltransferase